MCWKTQSRYSTVRVYYTITEVNVLVIGQYIERGVKRPASALIETDCRHASTIKHGPSSLTPGQILISEKSSRVACAHICLNEGWGAPSMSVVSLYVRSSFRLSCVWSGKAIRYRGCITPLCEHGAQMVKPGCSAADHEEFDAMREEGLPGSIGPFLKQY